MLPVLAADPGADPVLHGTDPSYLGPPLRPSDVPGRRSLRLASSHHVTVPSVDLSIVGARAFQVHGLSDCLEQFDGGRHFC